MNIEQLLNQRANSKCELCNSIEGLTTFKVEPKSGLAIDDNILICKPCDNQISKTIDIDVNHWHCLNESMWSEVPAVKVVAWRMLKNLSDESWARDALEMIYLDETEQNWAQDGFVADNDENAIIHRDSNGTILAVGDTVSLTKSLDVKGTTFTAKRGTPVRNISLIIDNTEQIEGRVNGQKIVILTKFVKKS
ncbi:MAG: PhnA domain-containing protein [Rhizobiales bacterium]|nr:PhnA domain-containing protein [Hyphomicrobiales bacterium]